MPPVEVATVYVQEDRPPAGEEARAWMRLTHLVGEDCTIAQAVLNWSRARGAMARYCRLLKQGGRMADLRCETPERREQGRAVSLSVAWRMHPSTPAVREHPDVGYTDRCSEQAWPGIDLLRRSSVLRNTRLPCER